MFLKWFTGANWKWHMGASCGGLISRPKLSKGVEAGSATANEKESKGVGAEGATATGKVLKQLRKTKKMPKAAWFMTKKMKMHQKREAKKHKRNSKKGDYMPPKNY